MRRLQARLPVCVWCDDRGRSWEWHLDSTPSARLACSTSILVSRWRACGCCMPKVGVCRWSASVRAGIDTHRYVSRASCPCCMLTAALKWPGFAHSSRPPCHQPLSRSTLWLCVLVAGRVLVVQVCHGHPGRRRRSRRTVRVLTRPPSLALTRALALARALQHSHPHSCLLSRYLLLCMRVAALHACGRIAVVARS